MDSFFSIALVVILFTCCPSSSHLVVRYLLRRYPGSNFNLAQNGGRTVHEARGGTLTNGNSLSATTFKNNL